MSATKASLAQPTRRTLLQAAAGATGAVGLGLMVPGRADAASRITLGAYSTGIDSTPGVLTKLSTTIGQPLGIASVFRGQGDVWPGPTEQTLANGRTLLVSWHLDWRSYGYWASPAARPYLVDVARRVKAYGRTVAIRPWAEMNADWVAFQPTAAPTDGYPTGYAAFQAAWRHVVSVFRDEGVTNVRWVFNPTTDTYAETTDIRKFWPGSGYVDILGLDGYNWGIAGLLTWRSFADIYTTQYQRLVALGPGKPVWICEIGCADPLSIGNQVTAPNGQSKALWWTAMAATTMRTMPAVKAVVLFDALKERDWRAGSSSSALTGLRSSMASLRRTYWSRRDLVIRTASTS